jgi:hypothetical protein
MDIFLCVYVYVWWCARCVYACVCVWVRLFVCARARVCVYYFFLLIYLYFISLFFDSSSYRRPSVLATPVTSLSTISTCIMVTASSWPVGYIATCQNWNPRPESWNNFNLHITENKNKDIRLSIMKGNAFLLYRYISSSSLPVKTPSMLVDCPLLEKENCDCWLQKNALWQTRLCSFM